MDHTRCGAVIHRGVLFECSRGNIPFMKVHQLPADQDNYIYVLRDETQNATIVVDPTEAQPVISLCSKNGWAVDALLITHHHPDHIRGISALRDLFQAPVYGFAQDSHRLPPLNYNLKDGDDFKIKNIHFDVKHTPGHTLGHVNYFLPKWNYLFCGDTLFSMGCGRLFEGSPQVMLTTLDWIRSLPKDTTVFCSHEYTQVNTEFALSIDPRNDQLKTFYETVCEKRASDLPTVPFSLNEQLELNPLLRWDDKSLRKNLNMETASDVDIFTKIRSLRNQWPAIKNNND